MTQDDPYSGNPSINALFKDFTGFKNNRNCAVSQITGDITFENFKCEDNKLAGIEISLAGFSEQILIKNAVIVGKSNKNSDGLGLK